MYRGGNINHNLGAYGFCADAFIWAIPFLGRGNAYNQLQLQPQHLLQPQQLLQSQQLLHSQNLLQPQNLLQSQNLLQPQHLLQPQALPSVLESLPYAQVINSPPNNHDAAHYWANQSNGGGTPSSLNNNNNNNIINNNNNNNSSNNYNDNNNIPIWGHTDETGYNSNHVMPLNRGTNLFINYLPLSMTERELYALFGTIGAINASTIMRDKRTGNSLGFGFIDYFSSDDSQRAIDYLDGVHVRNRCLKVSYARVGGDPVRDTKLCVTQFPRHYTENQLENIFNKFGYIVQLHILRSQRTGKSRGVAFVRYEKREQAQHAIAALNGVKLGPELEPLVVCFAKRANGQPEQQ